MKWKVFLSVALGLSLLSLWLAACGATPEPCPECPTAEFVECPTAIPCAKCPPCPQAECPEAATSTRLAAQWAGSAHADAESEAFSRWAEDDPAVVPRSCAKCHSEGGYLDFLGVDGSEARVVNHDQPSGTVVSCDACHNEATVGWRTVVFSSGAEISGLGSEARCVECHQGVASKLSVDHSIAEAGFADDDTVSRQLGFTDIHAAAAAASLYGTFARGGYEYGTNVYDGKHNHVAGFESCVQCHDVHTLELKAGACAECHAESDPRAWRMAGSLVDYDGDGDLKEGIYYEVEGLQKMLYMAIQAYAEEVCGASIVYEPRANPYFFVDSNANGAVDTGETAAPNQYNAWTGRLSKAAYNYHASVKDAGSYAHGGKYVIQLLYDSIESLNEVLSSPVDLSNAHRIDHGHFAGSEQAFRRWDDEGIVPGHCARCHTKDGLPLYLAEGVNISAQPSNGLNCATCHNDLTTFSIYEVTWVRFPKGTLIDSGDPQANLCLNCHQGLSSIATVNGAIGGLELDAVSEELESVSIHYFAAGATLYGTEVQGAYEYATEAYNGRLAHVEAYRNCTQCHDTHRQDVEVGGCGACHQGVESREDLVNIRTDGTDYDGDGNTSEGVAGEIETMRQALYEALQDYAASVARTPIIYDGYTYPYFFTDTDGNGQVDEGEAVFSNRYATWTPRLLRAGYNYQYAAKDPGAFAHNPQYVMQILYDSVADLGGDVSSLVRPEPGG